MSQNMNYPWTCLYWGDCFIYSFLVVFFLAFVAFSHTQGCQETRLRISGVHALFVAPSSPEFSSINFSFLGHFYSKLCLPSSARLLRSFCVPPSVLQPDGSLQVVRWGIIGLTLFFFFLLQFITVLCFLFLCLNPLFDVSWFFLKKFKIKVQSGFCYSGMAGY